MLILVQMNLSNNGYRLQWYGHTLCVLINQLNLQHPSTHISGLLFSAWVGLLDLLSAFRNVLPEQLQVFRQFANFCCFQGHVTMLS